MGSYAPLTFFAGVMMGTGSAVTTKILYGLTAEGESGEQQYFEKPLLLTLVMFVAMMLALPLHWMNLWREARQRKECGSAPLLADSAEPTPETSWRTLLIFIVPSIFDLLATALGAAGLIFTTVSIYQLIRCSVMIVTAILRVTMLGEKLKPCQWWGVAINTVAMILVSAVSFVPDHSAQQPGPYRDPRIGVLLILMSCVVQALQYVFEERLMKNDSAAPLLTVGMEGVWGVLLMVIIVFPWAAMLPGGDQGGMVENVYDSWIMIENSPMVKQTYAEIQFVLWIFFISVLLYNIFAIYVTYLLNSIWHAILENFRPISVWAVDLALYYVFTSGAFGERWTRWSWMELTGMIVLFAGTAVYNGTIELPFFEYPSEVTKSAEYFTSDSITSSPLISHGARARRLSIPITNLTHDASNAADGSAPGGAKDPATQYSSMGSKESKPLLGSSSSSSSSLRTSPHGSPKPNVSFAVSSTGDSTTDGVNGTGRKGSKAKKQSSHAQGTVAAQL